MRILLTICGFRLQFADSTYSCGFRDSLTLLKTYIIICSWILQTGSQFHTLCCGFRKVACFEAILSNTVFKLFIREIQNSREDLKKNSNVVDSATNLNFACWKSTYNSQNAQFGLVILSLNRSRLNIALTKKFSELVCCEHIRYIWSSQENRFDHIELI